MNTLHYSPIKFRAEEMKNECKILVLKPEVERSLQRPRRVLRSAIPVVCVKTNGKVIRSSITQLCMSIDGMY